MKRKWMLAALLGAVSVGLAQARQSPYGTVTAPPAGPTVPAATAGPTSPAHTAEMVGPGCPGCEPVYICVRELAPPKMVPQYYSKQVPVCIPNARCRLFSPKPSCEGDCGGECGKIMYKTVVYKRMVPQESCVMKCVPKEVPCARTCVTEHCGTTHPSGSISVPMVPSSTVPAPLPVGLPSGGVVAPPGAVTGPKVLPPAPTFGYSPVPMPPAH